LREIFHQFIVPDLYTLFLFKRQHAANSRKDLPARVTDRKLSGRFRSVGEVHLANNSCVFGTGSPFGEDECGDFYARPLSSWSVLLALQGFIYDGPGLTIGFMPVWQPEDHASFFSASEGWGLFTQTRDNSVQSSGIEVKYGTVQLKKIVLGLPDTKTTSKLSVMLDGADQAVESSKQTGKTMTIELNSACEVKAGSTLAVSFELMD